MVTEEIWPYLDAVRHINQFGSPEQPMMEIACTPEKSDIVREFLHDNNIETWPVTTNPFTDPTVDAADESQAAYKKRIGHFTRVLAAWWKAANFVQSRDTALFYQRLIKQAIQGNDALHQWPKHVIGVSLDARGVNDSNENPDIAFEYTEGFDPPPRTNKQTKKQLNPQLRAMATGGTLPSKQAVKRQRQSELEEDPPFDLTATMLEEPAPSTIEPAPAMMNHAHLQPPATPEVRKACESPAFRQTPLEHITAPAGQHSQYFSTETPSRGTARMTPGPSTPAAEKTINIHIQVSASGTKLRPLDPRASTRTRGVEEH